jgi:two-component system, OmpR family, phosphate regulon response regulator PhoB
MARILVVEDEKDIQEILEQGLRGAGYKVKVAGTARDGLIAAREGRPDIALVDVSLPDGSGLEVAKTIKREVATCETQVVLLTTRANEEAGLSRATFDDVVVKPVSVREVLSRVGQLLRRANPEPDLSVPVEFGALRIDRGARRVWASGEEIDLTGLELRLLVELYDRRGRVLSREALLSDVWGIQGDVTTRTVDTHVKRLREKLGGAGAYIETVRGVGYRFATEPKPDG